jgi:hypothetical protein
MNAFFTERFCSCLLAGPCHTGQLCDPQMLNYHSQYLVAKSTTFIWEVEKLGKGHDVSNRVISCHCLEMHAKNKLCAGGCHCTIRDLGLTTMPPVEVTRCCTGNFISCLPQLLYWL